MGKYTIFVLNSFVIMKPKVIAIAGPTASGKTQMSIDLAKQIDGEIISLAVFVDVFEVTVLDVTVGCTAAVEFGIEGH